MSKSSLDSNQVIILSDNEENCLDIDVEDSQPEVKIDSETSKVALVYPESGSDSITIYEQDLLCLDDFEYVNDNIINFYLMYIQRTFSDLSKAQRVHIFSTFFFSRLTKRLRVNPNDAKRNDEAYAQMMREKYHTKVSKWTKTVDIFSKDYLFVPILRRHHWLLAVVCHPGEQPQPICSQPTNDNEPIKFEGAAGRPCIIVFDSLNGVTGRSQLTYPLRYFLEREWQLRKQCERSFEKSFMPEYFPRTPKQPNDHDCALFVMEYVERLLAHPEHVLASDHIEVDLRDWFDRDKVIAKRVELVDLILKLSPNTLRSDIERLRQSRLDARSERLIRRKALMAANAKRGREKTRKSSKCVKRETTDQPHSIDIESDSTSIQEEEEEKSQKQDENNSLEILNDLQQPENSLQVIESN